MFALHPELELRIAQPFYEIVDPAHNVFALRLDPPLMLTRDIGIWIGAVLIAPAVAALVIKLILPRRKLLEIGSIMFGKYDENKKLIPAEMELVRLAIPRRVYTQSHIDYVAEVLIEINKNKKKLKGFKIIEEPKFLRHFTLKLAPID